MRHFQDALRRARVAGMAAKLVTALALAIPACAGAIDDAGSSQPSQSPQSPPRGPASSPAPGQAARPVGQAAPAVVAPDPGSDPGSEPAAPVTPERLGGGGFVRLSSPQIANLLKVLFASTGAFDLSRSPLPPDPSSEGRFANDSALLAVSPTFFEDMFDLAAQVAHKASATPEKLAPCLLKSGDDKLLKDEACVRGVIESFGHVAFRRPLTPTETNAYLVLYRNTRMQDGARVALDLLLQTLVVSPHTLLRREVGVPVMLAGRPARHLTSVEMASALSFFLTNGPPDAALMQAGEANELNNTAQVLVHARRLMSGPSGHAQLVELWTQLLGLRTIYEVNKDKKYDAFFNPELREAMYGETKRFLDAALWDEDGKLRTLLTAPFTFINERLARDIYKLAMIPMGDTKSVLTRAPTDPAQRAGLLTQPSFLTNLSASEETFPIRRGRFVRERLLCQSLPAPPPGVSGDPVPPDATASMRKRLAKHVSNESCAACHRFMDDIGLGFEAYDAVGRWRAKELDKPVDESGRILMADGRALPFVGPVALGSLLAGMPEVNACITRQVFRFGMGRSETPADEPALAALTGVFTGTGGSLPELVLAIVKSDVFAHREEGTR